MPFVNRIRLPLYLKTPQFPTEANRFRKSNGESQTLSVTIRKQYNVQTDYMGELTHQRLVIALNHDNVTIEGDKYVGGVTVDSDYEIQWPDWLDYPLGQGTVKIQVTPFDMTNSNCQTCEEATQLSLVDDDAGEIAEGAAAEVGVYGNDSICCFPITAEIVSFASGYLDSATIDEATGIATLTAKNPVASVGSIVLATYRVTCPDGSYDEADIYGSIAGSEPACEQPADFDAVVFSSPPSPYTATITWGTPAVPPGSGYEWILYIASDLGTPVDTGVTAINEIELTGLDPATDYVISVRSVCSEGVYSPYTDVEFTTPASGVSDCGKFTIAADDGGVFTEAYDYSYMDCEGVIRNKVIINLQSIILCLLTDENDIPVYFETPNPDVVTYSYIEPC